MADSNRNQAHPGDGLLIRIISTGEVVTKSTQPALRDIAEGKAERVRRIRFNDKTKTEVVEFCLAGSYIDDGLAVEV